MLNPFNLDGRKIFDSLFVLPKLLQCWVVYFGDKVCCLEQLMDHLLERCIITVVVYNTIFLKLLHGTQRLVSNGCKLHYVA